MLETRDMNTVVFIKNHITPDGVINIFFSMAFRRFIIPEGNPTENIQLLSQQMRDAWDEAGQRRFRFTQYKKALRKFHLNSVESDEIRALLKMVRDITH